MYTQKEGFSHNLHDLLHTLLSDALDSTDLRFQRVHVNFGSRTILLCILLPAAFVNILNQPLHGEPVNFLDGSVQVAVKENVTCLLGILFFCHDLSLSILSFRLDLC